MNGGRGRSRSCIQRSDAAMGREQSTPLLYSVPEAAAKLRVAPKWLYERTRKNAVPYRRLGKYVRFSEEDLATIVAQAFTPTMLTNSGNIGNHDHKTGPQRENVAGADR